MASGDPVVKVLQSMPPATSNAVEGVRAGGSTPAENTPIWRFADSGQLYMDFLCQLKGYAGGGITLTLPWMAATATSNAARWGAAFRRIQDDAEDLDTSQTYDYNYVTDTTASAAGEVSYPTIAFTDGADMDSVADGELFILRITRTPADAADTLAQEAQLLAVLGAET